MNMKSRTSRSSINLTNEQNDKSRQSSKPSPEVSLDNLLREIEEKRKNRPTFIRRSQFMPFLDYLDQTTSKATPKETIFKPPVPRPRTFQNDNFTASTPYANTNVAIKKQSITLSPITKNKSGQPNQTLSKSLSPRKLSLQKTPETSVKERSSKNGESSGNKSSKDAFQTNKRKQGRPKKNNATTNVSVQTSLDRNASPESEIGDFVKNDPKKTFSRTKSIAAFSNPIPGCSNRDNVSETEEKSKKLGQPQNKRRIRYKMLDGEEGGDVSGGKEVRIKQKKEALRRLARNSKAEALLTNKRKLSDSDCSSDSNASYYLSAHLDDKKDELYSSEDLSPPPSSIGEHSSASDFWCKRMFQFGKYQKDDKPKQKESPSVSGRLFKSLSASPRNTAQSSSTFQPHQLNCTDSRDEQDNNEQNKGNPWRCSTLNKEEYFNSLRLSPKSQPLTSTPPTSIASQTRSKKDMTLSPGPSNINIPVTPVSILKTSSPKPIGSSARRSIRFDDEPETNQMEPNVKRRRGRPKRSLPSRTKTSAISPKRPRLSIVLSPCTEKVVTSPLKSIDDKTDNRNNIVILQDIVIHSPRTNKERNETPTKEGNKQNQGLENVSHDSPKGTEPNNNSKVPAKRGRKRKVLNVQSQSSKLNKDTESNSKTPKKRGRKKKVMEVPNTEGPSTSTAVIEDIQPPQEENVTHESNIRHTRSTNIDEQKDKSHTENLHNEISSNKILPLKDSNTSIKDKEKQKNEQSLVKKRTKVLPNEEEDSSLNSSRNRRPKRTKKARLPRTYDVVINGYDPNQIIELQQEMLKKASKKGKISKKCNTIRKSITIKKSNTQDVTAPGTSSQSTKRCRGRPKNVPVTQNNSSNVDSGLPNSSPSADESIANTSTKRKSVIRYKKSTRISAKFLLKKLVADKTISKETGFFKISPHKSVSFNDLDHAMTFVVLNGKGTFRSNNDCLNLEQQDHLYVSANTEFSFESKAKSLQLFYNKLQ